MVERFLSCLPLVACLLPTTHLLCKSFRHSLEWLRWVTLAEFQHVWWMPAAEFNKTWSHNNKIQPKIAIIATLMKCRNLMLVVSISCHLPLAHTAPFYVPVSSTSALDRYPDLQFITTRERVKKQLYSQCHTQICQNALHNKLQYKSWLQMVQIKLDIDAR